jgi:hypothetical protein
VWGAPRSPRPPAPGPRCRATSRPYRSGLAGSGGLRGDAGAPRAGVQGAGRQGVEGRAGAGAGGQPGVGAVQQALAALRLRAVLHVLQMQVAHHVWGARGAGLRLLGESGGGGSSTALRPGTCEQTERRAALRPRTPRRDPAPPAPAAAAARAPRPTHAPPASRSPARASFSKHRPLASASHAPSLRKATPPRPHKPRPLVVGCARDFTSSCSSRAQGLAPPTPKGHPEVAPKADLQAPHAVRA